MPAALVSLLGLSTGLAVSLTPGATGMLVVLVFVGSSTAAAVVRHLRGRRECRVATKSLEKRSD